MGTTTSFPIEKLDDLNKLADPNMDLDSLRETPNNVEFTRRAKPYYKPLKPGDSIFSPPYPFSGKTGFEQYVYPRKQLTPVSKILFSAKFIKDTIDRVQLSLYRIVKKKFVPQRMHPVEVVTILEDVYTDMGITIDNSALDPSPQNINRIVYKISDKAIYTLIAYGYRFLQDHSAYVHIMASPTVLPAPENENIFGSRETETDDKLTASSRTHFVITPGSQTPFWV